MHMSSDYDAMRRISRCKLAVHLNDGFPPAFVVRLTGVALPIEHHHIRHARADRVPNQILRVIRHSHHVALAVPVARHIIQTIPVPVEKRPGS